MSTIVIMKRPRNAGIEVRCHRCNHVFRYHGKLLTCTCNSCMAKVRVPNKSENNKK